MRILVLSDLHLEMWGSKRLSFDTSSNPDVVVLAGDIHSGARAVQWAAETFQGIPVIYVHGNHEAYNYDVMTTQASIHAACTMFENVHFLQGEAKLIDGVRFLGATLWTDFCLFGDRKENKYDALREAAKYMNDYRAISFGDRKLDPEDTEEFHRNQRRKLQEILEVPFDGKTVVISHMAPSMKSVSERFAHDLTSAAYASNLDLMAMQADLWIHGHTHDSKDYEIGKCRVICNPCGYPYRDRNGGVTPENVQFNKNLIIEI